jgi:glucosamine--fructose-6-phosphate aminotransferase (isomerizing)
MIEGIVPREIREGPDAIRATLDHALRPAAEAADELRSRGVRRVYVIGNGTSYHSCLAAAGLYRRHAGPDDPVVIPLTAAEFQVYRPSLDARDAVVGISSSGEFRDVVAAAEELRGRTPVVGIVHVPGSTLTRVASRTVLSAGGPSTVPVMTKTFSCTLVATELVLLGLLGAGRAAPVVDEIASAADHAQAAIAAAEPQVQDLVERLASREHLFVAGGGLAYPAALEAALKLKEMALVHAEGAETWEMTSGVATMLGPSAVVIGLAPAGPARAAMAELLGHAAGWGAGIIEVGPEALVPGSGLLPLPAAALEDHAPLTAVPPVALLAFALARRRGANPDHPGWIERYHSQGLTHILGAGEAAT